MEEAVDYKKAILEFLANGQKPGTTSLIMPIDQGSVVDRVASKIGADSSEVRAAIRQMIADNCFKVERLSQYDSEWIFSIVDIDKVGWEYLGYGTEYETGWGAMFV